MTATLRHRLPGGNHRAFLQAVPHANRYTRSGRVRARKNHGLCMGIVTVTVLLKNDNNPKTKPISIDLTITDPCRNTCLDASPSAKGRNIEALTPALFLVAAK